MVVDNLYVVGVAPAPPKNESPLIVNPDRMEALPISFQALQSITWRGPKVLQVHRLVEIL